MSFRMIIGSKHSDFSLKPVVREFFRLGGTFNLSDYIPFVVALDLQGLARRMKEVRVRFDEIMEKIIDQHEQDAKEEKDHNRDLVDTMLSLMAEASSSSKDEQHEQSSGDYCNMDRTDIKANVLNIIGGAIDSSAATIEWAFTELLRHEQVMKNVQQELQRVVGMNRAVEEDDLAKLEYLDMVVKEKLEASSSRPIPTPTRIHRRHHCKWIPHTQELSSHYKRLVYWAGHQCVV
uniref:Cytochrome P450 CYP736A12-like n=1 Tax=Nelumbo nucifera TaxID=4432 RepID=A0A822YMA5_NELNU|nr:TPA_asm: hypothetical protein HUJ06_005954 [Nelumbo nucifera]